MSDDLIVDGVNIAAFKIEDLLRRAQDAERALALVLDQVDYTAGACKLTEMVGAVLPREVILTCRLVLLSAKPAPTYTCPHCGAVSYNLGDIVNRYCGRCHRYYDGMVVK